MQPLLSPMLLCWDRDLSLIQRGFLAGSAGRLPKKILDRRLRQRKLRDHSLLRPQLRQGQL